MTDLAPSEVLEYEALGYVLLMLRNEGRAAKVLGRLIPHGDERAPDFEVELDGRRRAFVPGRCRTIPTPTSPMSYDMISVASICSQVIPVGGRVPFDPAAKFQDRRTPCGSLSLQN